MQSFNFVALDFETATFERSSICEIGVAVVRDSQIVEKKSWLVKPKYNYYDGYNIAIHGITPAMTKNSPNFQTVWKEVLPYLDGNTVVSHNTSFDMYALKDALDMAELDYPTFDYFCSFRIARYVVNYYRYSLDALCFKFGIEMGNHHRAGDDAVACAKVFLESLNLAEVDNLDDLQDKYEFRKGHFSQANHTHNPQMSTRHSTVKVGEIVGNPEKVDPANYIYGKSVCLTGTMSFGTRQSILQVIADIGGVPMNSVTRKTDILVVGTQDFKIVGESGMSSKQKKAMDLRDKGADIEIMSEMDFLNIVQFPELKQASEEEFKRCLEIAERKAKDEGSDNNDIVIDLSDIIEKSSASKLNVG